MTRGPVVCPNPYIESGVESSTGATQNTKPSVSMLKQNPGPAAGSLHPMTANEVSGDGD